MIFGGIDLGGTKIEARLFEGAQAETVEVKRIPTPQDSYEVMFDAVVVQIEWLVERSQDPELAVGISVPGILEPETGISFASNIPSTGHSISLDLSKRFGREFPVINDCMAFTLSEAEGGAGCRYRSVMGLVIGTGVGGGYVIDGVIPHRHAGLAIEIGHLGIPARALARHDLPLFACGCGQTACFENYMSGTGFANLAQHLIGERVYAHELTRLDPETRERMLLVWGDLAGECLAAIQQMLDPDCIVIGGGMSQIEDICDRLSTALDRTRLGTVRKPVLATASFGDSSGARGAALLARRQA